MNAQEYFGDKIEAVADTLFTEKRKIIYEKIRDCVRSLGDYVDSRKTITELCKELTEILDSQGVKEIPVTKRHVQQLFYDQAWNIIKNQGTH